MAEAPEHGYGFGMSRDAHIAFAAAYISILLTVGGFGILRFVAQLPVLHVQQVVTQTRAIAYREKPEPDPAFPHTINFYPRVAMINRQEGTVVVRLLVLATGDVGSVDLVRSSGYSQIDAAALIGAGNWRYLPAVRNGRPVRAEVEVAIRFRLSG